MSNKIIKKAAACGLSAVMAFGLVAVTEAPKTANVSAATKKVKKLSFKKKGYVISAPGHWMNAKTRLKFSPKSAKTYKLKYKTSNKKIATISKNGIIRAKKKGTVTITAIAKNSKKAKATTKVTVGKVVKTLKFKEGTKKTVTAGKKFTLHPTYSPKKASTKAVTFKSSNKKVATVTSKGKVTAKKAGKVTITATCKDAKGKKAKFIVTVKAAPAPAKVVTPETVKPVVKDNIAEYTGLVANAEKYVLTRGKQTVEISAAQVKEALGYIADPAAGFKAWESKENFTLGVLSATGKGATKTATIKGTSNYDGKYTATVTKVSDTEYAVAAKSEKGQNHNIKVTVAKDGTVTATSAKYVVTSDKNATNIVVKDAAGKVIASATAKDGKYTVKLPADKAKDLTITQYVAK